MQFSTVVARTLKSSTKRVLGPNDPNTAVCNRGAFSPQPGLLARVPTFARASTGRSGRHDVVGDTKWSSPKCPKSPVKSIRDAGTGKEDPTRDADAAPFLRDDLYMWGTQVRERVPLKGELWSCRGFCFTGRARELIALRWEMVGAEVQKIRRKAGRPTRESLSPLAGS